MNTPVKVSLAAVALTGAAVLLSPRVAPEPARVSVKQIVWGFPPDRMAGVSFNVYTKTNWLQPYEFYTNVTETICSFEVMPGERYFRVAATNADWLAWQITYGLIDQ